MGWVGTRGALVVVAQMKTNRWQQRGGHTSTRLHFKKTSTYPYKNAYHLNKWYLKSEHVCIIYLKILQLTINSFQMGGINQSCL